MKTGVELIAEEREAHATREGWTAKGDSQYANGTLTMAAIVYATCAASSPQIRQELRSYVEHNVAPLHWPWNPEWWKPGKDDTNASRIRELVKAGSLIAAEIDRLQAQ